jgi:hypothetical protein
MADPTGAIALEATEIFEMEHDKEQRDAATVLALEKSASEAHSGDGGDPDPLAHLPEHFRKEIEAQAQVVSRKISFKVQTNHGPRKIMEGTISICRTSGEVSDVIGDCDGYRIGSRIPSHDRYLWIGIPPLGLSTND